jgi:hypothetical protein
MAEAPQPLSLLAVGQPYHPDRRSWPEGADYNFHGGGHELRIFLGGASREEVAAIESGPVEFGLWAEAPGLLLIVRFGAGLSFDCSYSWHRMARTLRDRTLPPATEETSPELRALVTVILVDADDGRVLVLRAVTFSPEFSRVIHRTIRDQAAAAEDAAGHERWVADLMRSPTDQLWSRCPVRCRGGA